MIIETTVYLVKPEGRFHKPEIRRRIEAAGLEIVKRELAHISEWTTRQLYPDMPMEIGEETAKHLADQLCEVGLVRGENAIARLLQLRGLFKNPAECAEGTIRRDLFSSRPPVFLEHGLVYYENGFHCPQNIVEEVRDRKIFGL